MPVREPLAWVGATSAGWRGAEAGNPHPHPLARNFGAFLCVCSAGDQARPPHATPSDTARGTTHTSAPPPARTPEARKTPGSAQTGALGHTPAPRRAKKKKKKKKPTCPLPRAESPSRKARCSSSDHGAPFSIGAAADGGGGGGAMCAARRPAPTLERSAARAGAGRSEEAHKRRARVGRERHARVCCVRAVWGGGGAPLSASGRGGACRGRVSRKKKKVNVGGLLFVNLRPRQTTHGRPHAPHARPSRPAHPRAHTRPHRHPHPSLTPIAPLRRRHSHHH